MPPRSADPLGQPLRIGPFRLERTFASRRYLPHRLVMQFAAMFILLIVACSGSLAQAGEPIDAPLSAEETAFLCALSIDFRAYRHGIPNDLAALQAAAVRGKSVALRGLPPVIACGGKQRRLTSATESIDGLGFSPDRSLAVVTGGYQLGPLHGEGGKCYFIRAGELWSLLGCESTWVS